MMAPRLCVDARNWCGSLTARDLRTSTVMQRQRERLERAAGARVCDDERTSSCARRRQRRGHGGAGDFGQGQPACCCQRRRRCRVLRCTSAVQRVRAHAAAACCGNCFRQARPACKRELCMQWEWPCQRTVCCSGKRAAGLSNRKCTEAAGDRLTAPPCTALPAQQEHPALGKLHSMSPQRQHANAFLRPAHRCPVAQVWHALAPRPGYLPAQPSLSLTVLPRDPRC